MPKTDTTITKSQVTKLIQDGKHQFVRFALVDGEAQFQGGNKQKGGDWEKWELPEALPRENSTRLYIEQVMDLHEF